MDDAAQGARLRRGRHLANPERGAEDVLGPARRLHCEIGLTLLLAACGGHGTPEQRAASDAPAAGVAAASDAPRWTRTFSGGDDLATAVAATSDGVVVAGNYRGELKSDSANTPAIGDSDLFVARLGSDGAVRWLRGLGSDKADFAWAVAAVGDATVVAAESDGTLDLDGERTRTSAQEDVDANPPLVLAFDATGKRAWWRGFASEESGTLRAVAAAGDRIAVGGRTTGRDKQRDLGAGAVPCDERAAFVAQLDSQGKVVWARCSQTKFGTASQVVEHVAIGRDGAVAACGKLAEGQLSFGGATVEDDDQRGGLFVALFAPDGKSRWLIASSDESNRGLDATCWGLGILEDGTVVVASNSGGTLGGVTLPDGAIVALDADGKPRWTESLPSVLGAASASVTALAVGGGRIWAAGAAGHEGVLVALDPASGSALGSTKRLGDVSPHAIAAGADTVYVAGRRPASSHAAHAYDAVVVALPSP